MANKFFSYSYQVERTKKTGIIFVIFLIVILGGTAYFYFSKNNEVKLNDLTYKVAFGVNEFEENTCAKAYRINSEKKTCGTICIKVIEKDEDYINKLRNNMETNGFSLTKTSTKKINKYEWDYFKTKNSNFPFNYYITDRENKTYSVEFIDQTTYLTKTEKSKCKKIYNTTINSLKIK